MKIAYLAPELPALSATFVYNEILQLESIGTEIIPFSVHEPSFQIIEPRVKVLANRTLTLYSESKLAVIKNNIGFLIQHPLRYFKTLSMLCSDIWEVGPFTRTAFGLCFRFFFAANLAKHLIQKKCDHLHVHFAHIPTDLAMYASSLSCVPFSVTAHANDLYERGWLLDKKVQRSKFFATISEFNKQYLAKKGVNNQKVEIIRCGVDPEQFSERTNVINNQTPKIGVIGRLVEKKGIDTLIKAASVLKKKGQLVELYIAGDGPLVIELTNLAREEGLDDENIFFMGAIPHSEVADFIKSLDAFVLPCKQDANGDIDGIPVVLMEAMLSGVPVITSKLSGIPELVVDKETGLLIESCDVEGLVVAVLSLINDDDLKERLIERAIIKVRGEFSLIDNSSKLNGLFVR